MKDIKFFAVAAVVGLVLLVAVYAVTPNPRHADDEDDMQTAESSMDDSPQTITNDLDQIDLGDVDGEFNEIDRDLNSL